MEASEALEVLVEAMVDMEVDMEADMVVTVVDMAGKNIIVAHDKLLLMR